jgi:hypothetical protein
MSLYKTQSYLTLRVNTGIDLSGADVRRILYKKPSGTRGYWPATADGQVLVYAVQAGDIDQSGIWSFQSYIEVSGRKGFGDVSSHVFEENISV